MANIYTYTEYQPGYYYENFFLCKQIKSQRGLFKLHTLLSMQFELLRLALVVLVLLLLLAVRASFINPHYNPDATVYTWLESFVVTPQN